MTFAPAFDELDVALFAGRAAVIELFVGEELFAFEAGFEDVIAFAGVGCVGLIADFDAVEVMICWQVESIAVKSKTHRIDTGRVFLVHGYLLMSFSF